MKLCSHPRGVRFYLSRVAYWLPFWTRRGRPFKAFRTARWY